MKKASFAHAELWIAVLLIGGVLLSRWFCRASMLTNFDAVNYVLAVEQFDVRLHQTQPPGYFLYIAGARLVNLFVRNPLEALTIFSTLASALGAWFVYLAGRAIFGRRAGLIGAVLLAVSTTFWHQGEIAAPYTGDLALSALAGWLCWRASKGQARHALLAALTLGVAGAYRPQTMFFLGPLLAFALWGRPWKLWLAAGALSAASAALLFSPAIFASGGLRGYTGAVFNLTDTTTATHQASYGYWRYLGYAITTAEITFAALGEALALSVLLGWWGARGQKRENLFLFLWILPTWAVFCLLYPGNPGTILVCMPPFFLWAGRGYDALLAAATPGTAAVRRAWIGRVLLGAVLAWQVWLFTGMPYNGLPHRLVDSADALDLSQRYFATTLSMIAELPAAETLVLTSNYRHIQYYLPAYAACAQPAMRADAPATIQKVTCVQDGRVRVRRDLPAGQFVPAGTRYVAFLDIPPEAIPASAAWLETRRRGEFSIWIIEIPTGRHPVWQADGLVLTP
ncbi:MAG: ArnT family glycosyltransferase [Chloroflexota bacterium]